MKYVMFVIAGIWLQLKPVILMF